MNYSYNLINPYQNVQQYPVNFGTTATVNPYQITNYALSQADFLPIQAANSVAAAAANSETAGFDIVGAGISGLLATGITASQLRSYAKKTGTTVSELLKQAPAITKNNINTLGEILKGPEVQRKENLEKFFKTLKESDKSYNEVLKETTSKAASGVKTVAKQSLLKKAGSFCLKWAYPIIEGATEMFSNVIPAYKDLGVKSGTKQVVKSTAKVAATCGGYAVGMKAGAAIGTCIGGPVGTAVGAGLGLLLGTAGSVVGSKLSKKVLGKDEIELAKIKEQEKIKSTKIQEKTNPSNAITAQQNVSNPYMVSQQQNMSNPYMMNQQQNVSNPYGVNTYITQDSADNVLMMPVRGFQLTA